MTSAIEQRTARVVVVETVPARRMLLADIVRSFGFTSVATVDKPQDLLTYLKISLTDWIIMPLASDHMVNGLHILKIITGNPELHHIRVSMLFAAEERQHIPTAFELGCLSCHSTPYNREGMIHSFEALFSKLVTWKGDLTLVAADYLRFVLKELRQPRLHLDLELALNNLYTGEPGILLNLAKAQLAAGAKTDALTTLNHVELLNKSMKSQLEPLRAQCETGPADANGLSPAAAPMAPSRPADVNLLGLSTCVIVDADSTVQYIAKSLLKDAGVPNVKVFSDGAEAWEWLNTNPEPDLIVQEWRLTGLTGPLLLQRIRQKGFMQVPILVASSQIKPEEAPLTLEMGVSALVEKPFNQTQFFKAIITALQQHRNPSEQASLERKIYQLLGVGNLGEAERLWTQYAADPRIPAQAKKHLEAEFLYARGLFPEACDLASRALRESQDSLPLLNLLGKCLLKVGRYQVALKCFGRAQEISPGNVERLCGIAEVQHYLGDNDAANATLKEAQATDAGSKVVREMTTNIALGQGDVKRASELMGKLESLTGILAFMNNRAIALTRSGQFDDGIALYRNTLMSLPPPWSSTHNSVTYNLGLAYARYGEFDRATDALEGLQAPIEPGLMRKRESLTARLEEAKASGGALQLNEQAERTGKEARNAGLSNDTLAALDLRRGDICCFLVFHAHDLTSTTSAALLAQMPAFSRKGESESRSVVAKRKAPKPA